MMLQLLMLATLAAQSPATPNKKLLALPVVGRVGVSPSVVTAINAQLSTEIRRIEGYQALTMADVEQMLSVEMRQQLVGCDNTGCLAEVAGALSSDEVLHGSVARLSATESVLTLTRLDAHTLKALGAEAARLSHRDPNQMLDAVGELLLRLYPGYQPPQARGTGIGTPLLGTLMFGLGLAMQWGSFATALTTPCWVWVCPPAVVVLYPALVANFLATPVLTSYAMTAMADILGRRVTAWRPVLKAGLATLLLGFLAVPLAQCGAFLLGTLCATPFAIGAAVTNAGGDPIAAVMTGVLLATFSGVGLVFATALPLMMALMGGTVLMQVVTVMRNSQPRPLGQDPRLPTLYAQDEAPPSFLGFLPETVLGGARVDALDNPPEDAAAPATAPAPADAPPTQPAPQPQPPPTTEPPPETAAPSPAG